MTVEFALDNIRRRMKELGYGDSYITRWKHIQLEGSASQNIDSYNEYHFLINPSVNVSVRSKLGVFDLGDTKINQMQYEHRGKITIANKTSDSQMVLFIQVIPNHKN
jgi:hypothetical protein